MDSSKSIRGLNEESSGSNELLNEQLSNSRLDARMEQQGTSGHLQDNRRSPSPSRGDDIKNSTRSYDLVIFGASGSIGKFLVEELALVVDKYYSNSNQQSQLQTMVTTTLGAKELRNPIQFAQNQRRTSVPKPMDDISWAVAGRSAMKLSETLNQAELSTGIRELSNNVPVILADLNHHKSLLEMCLKTNLVINCAGPYSMDGEALIRACVETGTNYIDLAHETTFIEQIRQSYSERARKAGIYIINGCGFQSMSVEMGLNFTKQVADGQIEEVKIILSLSNTKAMLRPTCSSTGGGRAGDTDEQCGIISRGMWNSWLTEKSQEISLDKRLVVSNKTSKPIGEKKQTSQAKDEESSEDGTQMDDDLHDSQFHRPLLRQDTQSLVRDIVEYKNRKSIAWLQMLKGYDETGRGYCLPSNSFTSEESQLIRGEMANYEHRTPDLDSDKGWKPIRCSSFLSLKSFSELLIMILWLVIFNIMIKFSLPRKLMKTFPVASSLGQVTSSKRKLDRDNLSHIKFCQTFVAYGTPGDDSGDPLEEREKHSKRKQEQLLVSRVVGPEPNHVATATYAVQAALALISEKDHLPEGGGVLTPGAAFSETNIIYQLRRRNIKFEVLKKA